MRDVEVDKRTSGALLREARIRAGLSQAELARRSGVAQSVISVYESGRRQPALPMLAALVASAGSDLFVEVREAAALDRLTGPLGRRVRESRSRLKAAAAAHRASNLAVFGSVARGEERGDSDVDLMAELPEDMGLFGLGRLQSELATILGARVDLVPEKDLKDGVKDSVLGDRVLL